MGYSVGETAHLGVTTLLAGVVSKGCRQSGYLQQCFQDATTRRVATHRTANPIAVVAR
jgi:hypothetical protein